MGVHVLDGGVIASSLVGLSRQYLVGRLSRPQVLRHVDDSLVEIGLAHYESAVGEVPHLHAVAREYVYVLSGVLEVVLLSCGSLFRFVAGDFFVLDPGTAYAQRGCVGTRLLFVKAPAGNDKVVVDPGSVVASWLGEALVVPPSSVGLLEPVVASGVVGSGLLSGESFGVGLVGVRVVVGCCVGESLLLLGDGVVGWSLPSVLLPVGGSVFGVGDGLLVSLFGGVVGSCCVAGVCSVGSGLLLCLGVRGGDGLVGSVVGGSFVGFGLLGGLLLSRECRCCVDGFVSFFGSGVVFCS